MSFRKSKGQIIPPKPFQSLLEQRYYICSRTHGVRKGGNYVKQPFFMTRFSNSFFISM